MSKIAIIGNGISGITAARHLRKLGDHDITVISGETDHFFSRTALMYIYMGHMEYSHTKPYEDWFWKKNGIRLVRDWVVEVDVQAKNLLTQGGSKIQYDSLILATGSKSNKFGWPGQDLPGVQGLYSYQDLETMERHTKDIEQAVIVGGGLIGVEMAEMLLSRKIPVVFLIREKEFWDNVLPVEEASMISRHVQEHHIDLRKETELKEILADDKGNARAIVTNKGEEIPCQFVGLTVGVSPNIDFLKDSAIDTNRGIMVNEYLETNIPDIYAIGDCAEFRKPLSNRRPIEQVWYTGRMQGETVARTVSGSRTAYQPGVWFNSAKFFDIEYQTYGHVWNQLKENESQFYWEHKSGKKCLKFVFDSQSKVLLGINSFGIRLRHEVFDGWLQQQKTIDYVLEHFSEANFDPEFFADHHEEVVNLFNEKYPTMAVKLKKKGFLASIFG